MLKMSLNNGIVDIEKPGGTCSSNFIVYNFSRLFLHSPFFYQRFKIFINGVLTDFWY